MKCKKILYVYGGLYIPNGMNAIISQKVNYLADNTDYEVYVTLTERPELPHYYKLSKKVKWINFNLNFDELDIMPIHKKVWRYWWKQRQFKKKLTDYIMKLHPDIIVSVTRREINFLPDINDGSKKVAEFHFARPFYRNFHKRNIPQKLNKLISKLWMKSLIINLKRVDKFVVLTNEDKKNWLELDNVEVIPNFISCVPSIKSDGTIKRVIAAGRYSEEKGYDKLISAWQIVNQRFPDWRLEIFGSGDNKYYQDIADSKGLSSSIRCNKAVPNISDYYVESSIYVMSSKYEGFGLVLVEAMASGIPVVSFSCPCGPIDIIKDGFNGLLAINGDIEDLAEKLCFLIGHEDVRKQLSKNAIVSIDKYRKDVVMQKWIALFDSLN